jgi:hypothetical protein
MTFDSSRHPFHQDLHQQEVKCTVVWFYKFLKLFIIHEYREKMGRGEHKICQRREKAHTLPQLKGLVAVCHSFCLFLIFYNIHTIIQSHLYNTFTKSSLHLIIACKLSGTELPVVPSRELNSGLPFSKPTKLS